MDVEAEIARTITLALQNCMYGDWDAFAQLFSSSFLNETVMKQTFFDNHEILKEQCDLEWTTEFLNSLEMCMRRIRRPIQIRRFC